MSVDVGGLGSGGGRVEETLPAGFMYVADSVNPTDILVTEQGQTVRFTIRGTNRFSYRVMASSVNGDYSFTGVLRDDERNRYTVGGASGVTVGPVANRSFSSAKVMPGARLTVTIAAGGYNPVGGRVEETLPSGFSYVADSVSPTDVRVTTREQMVRFTIRGTESFTYGVRASNTPGALYLHGCLERRGQEHIHGRRGQQRDCAGAGHARANACYAAAQPRRWWWRRQRRVRPSGSDGDADADAGAEHARGDDSTDAHADKLCRRFRRRQRPTLEPTAAPPTAAPTAMPRPTAVVVVPDSCADEAAGTDSDARADGRTANGSAADRGPADSDG